MRRRKRVTGIMTAILMAGVMAGCSVQAGKQVEPTTGKQQTKETVQETVQETELQKPTHPAPSQIQPFPDVEKETKAEPLIGGKRIILMTDIHYLAESLTDRGNMFQSMVEHGDGKLTNYVWEITDAALEEIKLLSPDALIISGDLSLQGEKKSHEELAKKLDEVEKAGITVLVIPGNHDINNPSASVYSGGDRYPAEPTAPEDFERIYKEFGYSEASSRDANSLSYTYDLGPSMRLLMLDTCQYEPRNKVGGMIKTETYEWIKEQLKQAARDSVILLPVAHHNLLEESKVYADDCTIEHSEELIQMLEGENIPLFLSGHLHVQRIRKHKSEPGVPEGNYGIQEIVTDALSIPPCQYGEVLWEEDGSISYATRAVDVSAWAQKNGSTNPDLLDFEDWSYRYIQKLISDQIRGVVKNLGADVEHSMAATYAGVYIDYYAGREIDVKGIKSTKGYRFWERNMPDSYLIRELDAMIADSDRDNNYFLLPEEEGWITGD